jgi:hypothetical protein
MEIQKAIYGLPQAGILANKLLKKWLKLHGYYKVPHTPGLWRHILRPIQFTLVVDNFGIKYVGRQYIEHLLWAIKTHYKVSEDWEGKLYCGIILKWNYGEKFVDISMPGYIKKALQRFKHTAPKKHQDQPFPCAPKKYGAAAQEPRPADNSPSAASNNWLEQSYTTCDWSIRPRSWPSLRWAASRRQRQQKQWPMQSTS